MKRSYGQYCPLALAAELLCQRWTILVVSRLIDGCTSFSAIQRGVPSISPSLLSARLKELEQAGLITRQRKGSNARYQLTQCGADLEPIVMGLAVWGQHWGRDMEWEDLDPAFLAWSMHLRMDVQNMPAEDLVLEFALSSPVSNLERFWLVKSGDNIEMCMKDPGLDSSLLVEADIRVFIEAWRGIRNLKDEISAGTIVVHGPRRLSREFPQWLMLSALAKYPRKHPGIERAC